MVGRLLRPVKPPRPSPPAELPHLSVPRIVPLFRGLPGGVSSGDRLESGHVREAHRGRGGREERPREDVVARAGVGCEEYTNSGTSPDQCFSHGSSLPSQPFENTAC